MDYYNYRCPVCEKQFDKDSEIVVCPVCGAPHHRECYEINMRCHFEDRHADGFDFKAEYSKQKDSTTENKTSHQTNEPFGSSDIIACQNCGTFNVASNDVCTNCGTPLEKDGNQHNPYDRHTQEQNVPPYQSGNRNAQQSPFPTFIFDPMGGLKPEDDLGDGVTVGEVSKFTKNNSPFFCRLFHQIKNTGKSRFSFVGFFFHGGWMLYRKMYKLGAFITALMAIMIIGQLYIETFYTGLMTDLMKATQDVGYFGMYDAMAEFFKTRPQQDQLILGLYALSSFGQIAVRLICAFCANKWYYKHCKKQITKIKTNSGTKEAADTALQTKGGVNGALALSLVITYAVVLFLPNFF